MNPDLKSALKRRTLEISAILMVTVVSAIVIYYAIKPLDAAACIGRPESEIIARLGPPSIRAPGNYRAPPVPYVAGHTNVETLMWNRTTGTLYVATSDETGSRVCFRANWIPAVRVY